MRRFSVEEIERLREYAAQGDMANEIAAALGRHVDSVRVKCKQLGIEIRKHPPLFSENDITKIRQLASRGFSAIGIAHEIGGGRTAWSVRRQCSYLGVQLRRKTPQAYEVRIDAQVLALLKQEAEFRGRSVQQLASTILSAVAFDKLVDAVIDDDAARQRKLEQAKKNRDNYRKYRREGQPILSPRDAALLGHQTALRNAGMLPLPSPPMPVEIKMPPQLFANVELSKSSPAFSLQVEQPSQLRAEIYLPTICAVSRIPAQI